MPKMWSIIKAVCFMALCIIWCAAGIPSAVFASDGPVQKLGSRTPAVLPPTSTPAGKGTTSPGTGPGDGSAIQKQLVKVVITTSRPEITRDHAWGLSADITNVSTEAMTLNADQVQLVMEPEATKGTDCNSAYGSFLPNTDGAPKQSADTGGSNGASKETAAGSDRQVILQPGEHYMFFWNGVDVLHGQSSSECQLGFWGRLAETLNFIPGTYTFVVDGKLHLSNSVDTYHTFAEAVTVKISIPQLTILLFAGLGSILAYLVVNLQVNGDVNQVWTATTKKATIIASLVVSRGMCSAFLLGSILSVVANRLSDTQFPVKVSVNDVWGSITVGFVFFFIGNKVLDKLKALIPPSMPQPLAGAPPAPGGPPPAPQPTTGHV
jgi:hypothetical protein